MAEIHIGGDVRGQVAIGDEVEMVMTGDQDDRSIVLFLASNPLETRRLQLDEEARIIEHQLRHGDDRAHLDFRSCWAVRPSDLQEALLRYRPVVVHFSGHGAGRGRIVLCGDDGRGYEPEPAALADLFGLLAHEIRCVVLNACHSEALAASLARHVDCVVGTRGAIEDSAAVVFARAFYQALAFGEPVRRAFELGRNELALAGQPDAEVPQLVVRAGVDPADVTIV